MDIRNYPSNFQITFSVSPVWFRAIRGVITSAASHSGFDARSAGQIAMAVDEALCNILRHGYQGDESGTVTLTMQAVDQPSPHLIIQILDDAPHVDLEAIKPRDLDDIRPGGLGLHLIRKIMDDVKWSKLESGGTKLRMTKSLDETMITSSS